MRQQDWSLKAHKLVGDVDSKTRSEYRTVAMKGPVLLQQSGVMQTLAFFLSRRDPAGRDWCRHLAEIHGAKDAKALLRKAQHADMPDYLRLSRDLIDISIWLRRFAQIILEPSDEPGAGQTAVAEGR